MKALFTPENRGAVLQGVRAGLTIGEAAERAGLASQTVRNWLSAGRAEDGTGSPHALFAEAVDEAREEAATSELSESEFHATLNRAVRNGSVQALRLWWAINQPDSDDRERLPDAIDELRAQRAARRRAAFGNGSSHHDETETA